MDANEIAAVTSFHLWFLGQTLGAERGSTGLGDGGVWEGRWDWWRLFGQRVGRRGWGSVVRLGISTAGGAWFGEGGAVDSFRGGRDGETVGEFFSERKEGSFGRP